MENFMGGGDLRETALDVEQIVHEGTLQGLLGQTDSGVPALGGGLLRFDHGVHSGSSVLVTPDLGAARRRPFPRRHQ
jgi:hypothetical protein